MRENMEEYITEEQMGDCISRGMTDEEIGKKYFCSSTTVERLRRKYGMQRKVTLYDVGMYLRMREKGLSDEDICYIFDTTPKALKNWRWRNGLTLKYKKRDV